jgi:large subunit ribosomal protein L18e
MPRPTGPTNPVLRKLIRQLRDQGRSQKSKIWFELAERLERSRRSRAEVNLSHLNRHAAEGSTILVPGKILAAGKLDGAMTVAAFKFSDSAKRKIVASGGKAFTIPQLLEQNPTGKGVRLME